VRIPGLRCKIRYRDLWNTTQSIATKIFGNMCLPRLENTVTQMLSLKSQVAYINTWDYEKSSMQGAYK
jgi:hypothetical protein